MNGDEIINSSNGFIQTTDEFTNYVSPTKIGRPLLSGLDATDVDDVTESSSPGTTSESSSINLFEKSCGTLQLKPMKRPADTVVSSSDDNNTEEPAEPTTTLPLTRQVQMRTDDDISRRFVCDVQDCFSNFKNKSSFYRHRVTYHGQSKNKKKKCNVIKRFICKICEVSNVYKTNFIRHYFDQHKDMDKTKVLNYFNVKEIPVDKPKFK